MYRKMIRNRLIILIALTLFLSMVASSQTKKSGVMIGTVTDSFGSLITGAAVEAKNAAGREFATKTNAEGSYRLELPEGRYRISVRAPGTPFNVFMISDYQMPYLGKMNLDVSLTCDNCEVVNSSKRN